MPYVSRENILQGCSGSFILIVYMKRRKPLKKSFSSFCSIIMSIVLSSPCYLHPTISSVLWPTCWIFMLVYYCRFPCVLVRCTLYYQKQRTFWHLLIGECCWIFVRWKSNCNLTVQNSTPAVSAIYILQCKGSLLPANLQRMTDYRPEMHMHFLHWPAQPLLSFIMYRHRSVCLSSLFLIWLMLLP